MKRSLSILLCVALLLVSLPFVPAKVTQVNALTTGYYTYTVANGGATITDVNSSISGDVIIPQYLGGYPVVAIGNYAFEDESDITSIVIPDSVTSIGYSAFRYCSGLEKMTLPFVGQYADGTGYTYFGYIFGASDRYYIDDYVPTSLKEVVVTSAKSVGSDAFRYCYYLTSIDLPDSLTSIGSYAFYNCYALTAIDLPDSVTSIGSYAFVYCDALTTVHLPDSLTSIGTSAFYGCDALTAIDLPDSVTSIPRYAFYDCSALEEINLPDGITYIGDEAFYNCDSLVSVTLPNGLRNLVYSPFSSCSNLFSVTLPESIESIGSSAFDGCGSLNHVIYNGTQDDWLNNNVVCNDYHISSADTFHYNGKDIKWNKPADAGSCSYEHFGECSECGFLLTRKISNPAHNFQNGVCADCGVDSDWEYKIYGSNVTVTGYKGEDVAITIPDYIEGLPVTDVTASFYKTNVVSVMMPNGLRNWTYNDYYMCSGLVNVGIPESMESINFDYSWVNGFVPHVIFAGTESRWNSINHYSYGLKYDHIHFNAWDDVEISYGDYGETCSFKGVAKCADCGVIYESKAKPEHNYLGGKCTKCGVSADWSYERTAGGIKITGYSGSKTVVNFPSHIEGFPVVEVKENVFNNYYNNIVHVFFDGSRSEWENINFNYNNYSLTSAHRHYDAADGTYVTDTSVETCTMKSYANCSICGMLFNKKLTPTHDFQNGVCSICGVADCWEYEASLGGGIKITGYTGLEAIVTVPETIEGLPVTELSGTFYENDNIVKVTLPNTVTALTYYTFLDCSYLTQVSLPDSLLTIDDSVFSRCSNLAKITLPEGLTDIGSSVFNGCSALTAINIPASVRFMDKYVFDGCSSLRKVTIGDLKSYLTIEGFDYWGGYDYDTSNPFYYGADLYMNGQKVEELVIPEGITEIRYNAFSGCDGIKKVVIPEGVTYIDGSTFYGCDGLEEVSLPEGVTSIGFEAFYSCDNLKKINIPSSVTTIEADAFNYCYGLQEVHITDMAAWCDITFNANDYYGYYGTNPLWYADGLYLNGNKVTEAVLPEGIKTVKPYVFKGYEALESVVIPESVINIGDFAFYGTGITQLKVPENVVNIGICAFENCDFLKAVALPEGIVLIKDGAFSGCYALEHVFYGGNEEQWEEIVLLSGNECLTNATLHLNSTEIIEFSEGSLIIGNAIAKPGRTVTLTVSAEDFPEFQSIGLENFVYDEEKLELVSAKWLLDGTLLAHYDSEKQKAAALFEVNTAIAGSVIELTFKLADEIEDGDLTVSFSAIVKKSTESGRDARIAVSVLDGIITVRNVMRGDFTGDDLITADDAIYLLDNLTFGDEYPLNQSADMNGDGYVNNDDAVYLLYHTFYGEEYPLAMF